MLLELLAAFRPDPRLLELLGQIRGSQEPIPQGLIPREWIESRLIGVLRMAPGQRWLDLRRLETREMLRRQLAPMLIRLGLPDLDVSTARGQSRELTQELARWAYGQGFNGIGYTSRMDDDRHCWAIFEGASFERVGDSVVVRSDDPDLVEVAHMLSLHLPGT